MPGVLVRFIHGRIGIEGHLVRIVLQCTPEVRDEAIKIVDSLYAGSVRTRQENSAGPKEWLHVILNVAEAIPNKIGNAGLAAEPGERGFEFCPQQRFLRNPVSRAMQRPGPRLFDRAAIPLRPFRAQGRVVHKSLPNTAFYQRG